MLRVPIGDKGASQWGKAEIDRRRDSRDEIRVPFLQPNFHHFTQFTNCFDEIVGLCVRNRGHGFVGNGMAFHATAIEELRKLENV